MEARKHVDREELYQKLAWVLGIDHENIQKLVRVEVKRQVVEVVFFGKNGYERVSIPWKKRKGIGSVLAEFHESSHEQDQEMLL